MDRSNEIAQVMGHLDRGEYLIAIEGNIGVGKSALAMEVAHRLAESRVGRSGVRREAGQYESLVWLDAHNRALSLTDVARSLSLAAGDATLSAAPADHKADALRAFLGAHPTVLVIDNLRLTAADAQHLVSFLRTLPAGSLAIVSANTPGRLEAPRVLLQELQFQYMHELLLREAVRRDIPAIVAADEQTFRRIHRLIGGNPRAIELFVLACSRALSSVNERLHQLESGAEDLTDSLFDAVWQNVTAMGRDLLAVCAFLGGSANQEQIMAAMALADPDFDQAVERLWSDGLISSHQRLENIFYSCSAALRIFVLKRSDDTRLSRMADRLADHYVDRFGRDWEDAEGATAHIEAVRLLIRDLKARGRNRECFDLFYATFDIFFTLGLFDDRIELGWVAYDAATALRSPEERSLALSVVSSTHAIRGEDTEAAQAVELGLRIARAAASQKEIARQLRCEGFRLFRAGQAAEALQVVESEDAEALARTAGDMNNMIDILSLVGAAYWHLGDLDACAATVERFLTACERLPWERGKAYAIRDFAELKLMNGSFHDAELMVQQARDIATTYRDVRQLVRVDLTDARLQLFQGRLFKARSLARVAAQSARQLMLAGERAEAEAVAGYAARAAVLPWLWFGAFRRPRTRFTECTVGGD